MNPLDVVVPGENEAVSSIANQDIDHPSHGSSHGHGHGHEEEDHRMFGFIVFLISESVIFLSFFVEIF